MRLGAKGGGHSARPYNLKSDWGQNFPMGSNRGMNRRPWIRGVLLVTGLLGLIPAAASAQADGIPELVARLQRIVETADRAAYLEMVAPTANRERATQFASGLRTQVTRAVVRERDRRVLGTSGNGLRLLVEVFSQDGSRGRIDTWRLDLRRQRSSEGGPADAVPVWTILNQEILTTLQGLVLLTLDASKQYTANGFSVVSEDFELKLPSGSVFLAESPDGVTGLVMLGRGELIFSPSPATEQGQLRIFCGQDVLRTSFDSAFIRLNPTEIKDRFRHEALSERSVDPRDLRRAEMVFQEE